MRYVSALTSSLLWSCLSISCALGCDLPPATSPASDAAADSQSQQSSAGKPRPRVDAPKVHTRPIRFGEMDWVVKSGENKGPGPGNGWSNRFDAVWRDDDGLHLKITKSATGSFSCAEVRTAELAEFGTYRITIANNELHKLDPNVVIGLFLYRDDSAEADIEIIGADAAGNLLFTVQPASERTSHRAHTGEASVLTFELHWEPSVADFKCWIGTDTTTTKPVASWRYRGDEVPRPVDTHFHANIWLLGAQPPESGEEVELLIRDFQFKPLGAASPTKAKQTRSRPSIQVWADGDGYSRSDVKGHVNGILPSEAKRFLVRVYATTDTAYIQPFVGSTHSIDPKTLTFKTWTRPWYNGLRADLVDTQTGRVVATHTYMPGSPRPKPGIGWGGCLVGTATKQDPNLNRAP